MFKDDETGNLKVSSLGEVLQKIGRYDGDDLNEMIAELQGGEEGPAPESVSFEEFMSLLHREWMTKPTRLHRAGTPSSPRAHASQGETRSQAKPLKNRIRR